MSDSRRSASAVLDASVRASSSLTCGMIGTAACMTAARYCATRSDSALRHRAATGLAEHRADVEEREGDARGAVAQFAVRGARVSTGASRDIERYLACAASSPLVAKAFALLRRCDRRLVLSERLHDEPVS